MSLLDFAANVWEWTKTFVWALAYSWQFLLVLATLVAMSWAAGHLTHHAWVGILVFFGLPAVLFILVLASAKPGDMP